MTKNFLNRIEHNHESGKTTIHGKYEYSLQFHPMAGMEFIIRKLRAGESWEWHIPVWQVR